MRLGVIRADLPGPVLLSALETVSQYNPSTEPRGQEVYISRPTVAEVEAVLAHATYGAGAVLNGGDISGSFPLVIDGTNDDLRIKTSSSAAFTVVLLPQASYANLTALITALNLALNPVGVLARENVAGNGVALESMTRGVASYIQNDTIANGSVANTPLSLANGATRNMPAASAFITATLPVGGPLDVSAATINGVGATTNANALTLIPASRGTQEALADAVAPQLIETPTVIDSFLVGQIAALLNAEFNPDPRRKPALVDGPAIEVVQDDGVTAFAATLPTITSATLDSPSAGDITIAGTGLGDAERLETVVKVAGAVNKVLQQKIITTNGGSVSDTAIVLKAVLIPGATTVTTNVRVQVRQRVSDIEAVA
jgi:hypothetical protein